MPDSFRLGVEECMRLLQPGGVGRIAVSTPTGPHIVPASYAVVGDSVVLRTSPYSVLGTYGRESVVALEADHFDHESQRGWSVAVRGRAAVVNDPVELEEIHAVSAPGPGGSEGRRLTLRIHRPELSGRRLGTGADVASRPLFSRAV